MFFEALPLNSLWQEAEERVYLIQELDKRTGQVNFGFLHIFAFFWVNFQLSEFHECCRAVKITF